MQDKGASDKQRTDLIFKLNKASSPYQSTQSRRSILKKIQQLQKDSQYSQSEQSYRVIGEHAMQSRVLHINISKGKILEYMSNGKDKKVSFGKANKGKESKQEISVGYFNNSKQQKHVTQAQKQEMIIRSQSQKIHKDIALLKNSIFSNFQIKQQTNNISNQILTRNHSSTFSTKFLQQSYGDIKSLTNKNQSRYVSTGLLYRHDNIQESKFLQKKHSPISRLISDSKFGLQDSHTENQMIKSKINQQIVANSRININSLKNSYVSSVPTRASSCRQLRKVKPIFQIGKKQLQTKPKSKSQKQKLNFQLQLFKRKIQLKMK